MSTEVPIYLVSACATGEAFVAAFRRYADRSGLFIPIADPLPVGKRGRFAITLTDGGVMVEGGAEVVSSTRTPSVLHGRIGMTLRFVEPDEPSKTVLVELEKARLSMRPAPPSVPPRPADVPATPRAVPPAPAGRIDSTNALAECVAIGNLDALEDAPSAPKPTGQKFVMPAVAPVSEAQRARSPSAPQSMSMRPRTPSSVPVAGLPGVPPATARPKSPSTTSTQPAAVVPPPMPAPAPLPARIVAALPATTAPTAEAPPARPAPAPRSQTMAFPTLLRLPAESRDTIAQPAIMLPPEADAAGASDPVPAPPVMPAGIPARFADGVPRSEDLEVDEPTDLTSVPLELASRSPTPPPQPIVRERSDRSDRVPRRTVLGIAVVPEGMAGTPAPASGPIPAVRDTVVMTAQPTVEEPTPSGNWTITPGADRPTLEPRATPPGLADAGEATTMSAPPVAPPKTVAPGPLTGDWTISLEPDSPDGWSEPSKVEKRASNAPGPPVSAVASTKLLDSAPKPEPVAALSGPKVEIDPTLMEPLLPVPALPPDDAAASRSGSRAPGATSAAIAVAAHLPTPLPQTYPTMAATTAAPPIAAPPAVSHVGFANSSSSFAGAAAFRGVPPARTRTRTTVVIGSALLAVALGIGALVMFGGSDSDERAGAVPPADAPRSQPTGEQAVVTPPSADVDAPAGDDKADPGSAAPARVGEPAATAASVDATPKQPVHGMCKVDVASTPGGAEVVLGKTVLGTTPTSLKLACGTEAKLVLRKARFVAATRTVTPAAKPIKLRLKLEHAMFLVKVSSSPPGATVTVGGKSIGVTPSTAKLPAFVTSTLTFSKPGYASETQRVTPKQNNQTIHTPLKKTGKQR